MAYQIPNEWLNLRLSDFQQPQYWGASKYNSGGLADLAISEANPAHAELTQAPSSPPRRDTGPQLASALPLGKPQGVVLDPQDRGEENLYRQPDWQEINRQLEQFHRATGGDQWRIQDVEKMDEGFRDLYKRFFTG